MKMFRVRCATILFLFAVLCAGCSNSPNADSPSSQADNIPPAPNVLAVTIGGAGLCTGVPNLPCVAVTICVPTTTQCQTVRDILLDTGAVGLRVFKSALTIDLSAQITHDAQGNQIGECLIFGTGADWGPVATAGVVLGNEPEVVVPIQLIDATFAGQSALSNPCGQPVDTDPTMAHFNGILGIDGFVSDQRAGSSYFSCGAGGCNPTTTPPSVVQNPIAALPTDNNGYAVHFPPVGDSGAPSLTGAVILGIGTRSNNQPVGVSVYMRDPSNGTISTTYKGTTVPAFFDTGSTFLFFQDATIPVCQKTPTQPMLDRAFCPPTPLNLSAINSGVGPNGFSGVVDFQVANAATLETTGHTVFNNLGGPALLGLAGEFDWGLPFYLGRTVYTGIEARHSVLGLGPYWAY